MGIISKPAPQLRLPDFTPDAATGQWDDVEVHAVWDDGQGNCDVVDDDSAHFYSVYLHQTEGGVRCIADVATQEQAITLKTLIETLVTSHINYKP